MYDLYNDNPAQQRKWRSKILASYPESDYAKIIQSPDILAETLLANQAEINAAKAQFKAQEFKAVIVQSEN